MKSSDNVRSPYSRYLILNPNDTRAVSFRFYVDVQIFLFLSKIDSIGMLHIPLSILEGGRAVIMINVGKLVTKNTTERK